MEQRGALAAYNELYKEQDDLYRAAARGFGLSDCAFWCCTPCGRRSVP